MGNKPSALEVPVYAPVDSYLLDFDYYVQSGDGIYALKFQVSCEVACYFDHLRSIVNKIQGAKQYIPVGNRDGAFVDPPLFFQAGNLIGYAGGTPMSNIWDFGVLNTQVWNDFPPKETYVYSPNADRYRFAVCQYFTEDLRVQDLAMLALKGAGRNRSVSFPRFLPPRLAMRR